MIAVVRGSAFDYVNEGFGDDVAVALLRVVLACCAGVVEGEGADHDCRSGEMEEVLGEAVPFFVFPVWLNEELETVGYFKDTTFFINKRSASLEGAAEGVHVWAHCESRAEEGVAADTL